MDKVLSVFSIIMVVYAIIFIIYRMFEKNGLKYKRIHVSTVSDPYYPTKKESFKVFGGSILFRIFVILLSFIIFVLFVNGNNDFSISGAVHNWVKWDAVHYMNIANGYASYIENGLFTTLVFFPLYPIFIAIFKMLFDVEIAGLIVSNLAISIACVYLYKLVCMDYGKKVAIMTLIIINIFPFAFFYSAIMSESIFLLFSILTLYYTRKHNWLVAGLFGLLCALSRSLGVFIIFPMAVELIEEEKIIKNLKNIGILFKTIIKKGLPLLLVLLGFGIYLYCNYAITGKWFYFLDIQSLIWHQEYTPFYLIFKTNFSVMQTFSNSFILCITIPQLIIIISSYLILFFGVRKHRTMYSAWLLVNIIVNTSMSWPLSVCRYFICAIPLYIYMANYLKKHRYLYIGYLIVSAMLFMIYFIAYLKGMDVY